MQIRKILAVVSILAIASLFCSVGGIGLPEGIQQTLEALTQQVPAIETQVAQQLTEAAPMMTKIALTANPNASAGSISGSLSYPAEGIPPLRVVAYRVDIDQYFYVDTLQNQNTYQIDNLPPATYHVVAYSIGGNGFPSGLAGGYSQAVPCGLSAACTDHSLIDVSVLAGQVSGGVNPQDWYAPEGTYPPMPAP
ncbi:MAG TPA: hypothetical protein VGJ22_12205 [Anaerolineales bacterium]|jgi:hypothetical protein